MSIYKICFYGEITKIIPKLPTNTLLIRFTVFLVPYDFLILLFYVNSVSCSIVITLPGEEGASCCNLLVIYLNVLGFFCSFSWCQEKNR